MDFRCQKINKEKSFTSGLNFCLINRPDSNIGQRFVKRMFLGIRRLECSPDGSLRKSKPPNTCFPNYHLVHSSLISERVFK